MSKIKVYITNFIYFQHSKMTLKIRTLSENMKKLSYIFDQE